MQSLFTIHQMYGYLLLLVLVIELVWTLIESIRDVEPGRFSSIKSSAVVGLIDLQVLLGIGVLYAFWPDFPHTHPVLMILAAVGLHLANKQSGWVRFGIQFGSVLLIAFGVHLVI